MIIVKDSQTHGKGAFAAEFIPAETEIIEYLGKRLTYAEFDAQGPFDPENPTFTYAFTTGKGFVIEAAIDGNDARFINHSCEPNCRSHETSDGRVFIIAERDIQPGEELFFDYGLVFDGELDEETIQSYACHCGTPSCRGTMLNLDHEPDLDGSRAFQNSTTAALERLEHQVDVMSRGINELASAIVALAQMIELQQAPTNTSN